MFYVLLYLYYVIWRDVYKCINVHVGDYDSDGDGGDDIDCLIIWMMVQLLPLIPAPYSIWQLLLSSLMM